MPGSSRGWLWRVPEFMHGFIMWEGGHGWVEFSVIFEIFDFWADASPATPSLMRNFRKWLVELRGVNLLSSKQYRGVVDEPETGATTFYDSFPKSSNFGTSGQDFSKSIALWLKFGCVQKSGILKASIWWEGELQRMIMEVARVHARIHHVGVGGPIFGSFSNFRFRGRWEPGDPIPDEEFS